jgi:hypothetical protein
MATLITPNTTASTRNVDRTPISSIKALAMGAVIRGERPKPSMVRPTANPLRSGNQRATTAIGTP